MPFTDEECDLLELCIQAQVAQLAFSSKITNTGTEPLVRTVQKLEEIADKLRNLMRGERNEIER